MAQITDVSATPRTTTGGALNKLRKSGFTPAIVYGKGFENQNVQVETKTFTKIIDSSASDNILVNLQIGDKKQLALVQEVQHDHLKGGIIHVDFHAVKEDEEIHAHVLVEIKGVAAGAKFGGNVELLHHDLEVRCLPKDLPEKISVDVTALNIGDALHIRELTLPAGVRAKLDGNVVVVVVQAPKEEVAATPAAAAAAPAAGAAAPAAGAAKAADTKAAPAKK
jgi:large subunit ribosomal protein L25